MMARTLTAALVQHSCTDNRERNLAKSEAGIREAHRQGAQLIVLPSCIPVSISPSAGLPVFRPGGIDPGPRPSGLVICAGMGVVLVLSLFEKRGAGLFHITAVVIEKDGSIAGQYRKTHIPDDPGFYEKFYFTPGDWAFIPLRPA
jgi:N-carbamoylputrescine amidase